MGYRTAWFVKHAKNRLITEIACHVEQTCKGSYGRDIANQEIDVFLLCEALRNWQESRREFDRIIKELCKEALRQEIRRLRVREMLVTKTYDSAYVMPSEEVELILEDWIAHKLPPESEMRAAILEYQKDDFEKMFLRKPSENEIAPK